MAFTGISPPRRRLDDARHSGIDEQRHFGEVAEFAPACSAFPESLGEILQDVFVVGFVHDNQTAVSFLHLLLAVGVESSQSTVKAVADLFKGVFHRVLGSKQPVYARQRRTSGRFCESRKEYQARV